MTDPRFDIGVVHLRVERFAPRSRLPSDRLRCDMRLGVGGFTVTRDPALVTCDRCRDVHDEVSARIAEALRNPGEGRRYLGNGRYEED